MISRATHCCWVVQSQVCGSFSSTSEVPSGCIVLERRQCISNKTRNIWWTKIFIIFFLLFYTFYSHDTESYLLFLWWEHDAWTHLLNVLVTVQSCVLCPAQASVSTTSCTTSSPCATPTRTWTSTSTASSAVWSGSKPCSVSQCLGCTATNPFTENISNAVSLQCLTLFVFYKLEIFPFLSSFCLIWVQF